MFLNGELKEEVYVAQPPGYELKGKKDKVYRLKKSLYGLKQAPCVWYSRIDAYLMDNDFDKCDGIDYLLIADFKEVMKSEFEMIDLGLLRYFLGIEVKKTENRIFISQEKYVADILERFNMQNNKPATTQTVIELKLSKEVYGSNVNPTLYNSMVGNLMYLTTTRLHIMYALSLVSRFRETPKETRRQATKRILR
eukprot:PITA_17447